jgi:hypothetical protein
MLHNVPIQALVMIPLARLAELASHEEQLLPRLCIHVPVQQAEIGELLPLVSGHFSE